MDRTRCVTLTLALLAGLAACSTGDDADVEVADGAAVPSDTVDEQEPTISVELWHCGVEPVTLDGRTWEVPDSETVDGHPDLPLDATNTPADWVGRGTVVVEGDTMTYTDEGGEVVGFVPDDGRPSPPCA